MLTDPSCVNLWVGMDRSRNSRTLGIDRLALGCLVRPCRLVPEVYPLR